MSPQDHDWRLREAALVLHGLHWYDRLWLLRQLLPAWRQSLQGLLRELRQLGMEPAFGNSRDLPPCLRCDGLDAASLALVDQASASRIQALLALEAPQVQAMVLCLHDWRWREAVWNGMSSLQRRRVLAHAAANRPAPGVLAALLAALAAALREEPQAETAFAHAVGACA